MKKLFTFLFAFLSATFAFAGTGTKADPYTISEAISKQNATPYVTGYVKGFIVGTVKAELTTVTTNGDIDWVAPFNRNSMVLIADSKTTRDISQCLFVNLPGGPIRDEVNLVSTPTNLGQWLNVEGVLRTYFGQAGLRDLTGSYEFQGANIAGAVLFEETFATSQGAFTTEDVLGAQNWHWANNPNVPSSPGYMLMSGHDGTNNVANEDLLISPAIDLSGAKSGTYITFKQAIKWTTPNVMAENQTLWITDGTNKEKINIANYPTGADWVFIDAGNMVVPSAYLKAGVQFIFQYKSVTSNADGSWGAWEINNIKVIDPNGTGVESTKESISIKVYPNPATDRLNVNVGDITAKVTVFDITGKTISTTDNVSGTFEIDVTNFKKGIYMVKVNSGNATDVKKVVVK